MATTHVGVVLRHIRRLAAANGTARLTDNQLLERFTAGHDDEAFATLIERHGAMVLGVCRRVLHHLHDAEDAFQATFLILARKAGSIRRQGSIAGWLYQVAYHLAVKARASAAKRPSHLRREVNMPTADPIGELNGQELRSLLDEELHQLPEQCRSALVLCYLEGKTQQEAAHLLGWSKGTLRRRLGQGRELLRVRLVRRGLSLPAALVATLLVQGAAKAAVRATLADTTVKAATGLAAGKPVAAVISAPVAALVEGGLRTMMLSKLKVATAIMLAVCIVSGAGAVARQALAAKEAVAQSAAPKPQTKAPAAKEIAKPQAAAKKDDDADALEVTGQVVGPDGKPVAGAKIFLGHFIPYSPNLVPGFDRVRATTGDDGRFQFRATRPALGQAEGNEARFNATITATAVGYGPAWATVYKTEQLAELTLKLVKDDVPTSGRVLDLEGKPIPGVTVRVMGVNPMAKESLKPWLDAMEKKKDRNLIYQYRGTMLDPAMTGLSRPVTTGADGRFKLTGIGRERIVALRFAGPTIETRDMNAMTRLGPTIQVARSRDFPESGQDVYHGATFDHAAAPTVPIVGTVRDKDTGKPLAGVTIQSRIPSSWGFLERDYLRASTDKEGRYRLVGLPKQATTQLEVAPSAGQPFIRSSITVAAGSGLDPVAADIQLKRGLVIRGKVTDKATGKPVVNAQVDYFAFVINPHLRDAPGFRGSGHVSAFTAADGSFTLVGLPGPGLLAAKAGRTDASSGADGGRYIAGSGADEIKGPRQGSHFTTDPFICAAPLYHTLVAVNPALEVESATFDVQLDPGKTVKGKLVGPDGKPMTGVQLSGVWGLSRQQHLKTDEFTLRAIDPKRPQPVFFYQAEKQLGLAVLLKGDEPKDFTVRLQPCATLTGRLLDEEGQPRAGVQISGTGRLFQQLTFKPGEKKDLGEVKADTSGY